MSPATRATRADTRTAAARLSRLRVLALAERERHHNGWSFTGDHVTQHCPCCAHTVRATAPDPPTDPHEIDRYERHVGELLNDAVLDHLRHHCDTPHEERP